MDYFGLMWKLFAMYAWCLVFISDHLELRGSNVLPAAILALGPMVGIAAMLRLRNLAEASLIAGARG